MTDSAGSQDSSLDKVFEYKDSPGVDATALANRQALLDTLDEIAMGEFEPFWALFDPEACFHEASCLPYGGSYQRLDEVKRGYKHMSSTFSAMRSVFHEVLTAGDYCILYQTITFTVAANGNTGTLPVAEIFRFRNSRIVEWRANYFDACQVAKAIAGG